MTVAERAARKLEVGLVVSRTGQVIRRNFGSLLFLSAIAAVSSEIMHWAVSGDLFSAKGVAGLFADVFITCVLTATVVPMVMHDFEQKRGPFDECLATGLSHLSKLLGISVVVAAASMGALLLLIVPGLFVLVILSVVVPVQVIEEKSVVQSLTRSIELTKGNRWSILILLLAFYAAAALAEIVISERGVAPTSGLGTFIARALVDTLEGSVGAVGTAVVYFELREEGAGPDKLASVFD